MQKSVSIMNVWVFGTGCQRWSVTLCCSNGLESPVRFRALSEFQTDGFCAERANGTFHNVRSNATASCLSNQTSALTKKPRLKPQRNAGRKFSLSSFSGQGMLKKRWLQAILTNAFRFESESSFLHFAFPLPMHFGDWVSDKYGSSRQSLVTKTWHQEFMSNR